MRRVIGIDIHRIFGEVVIWEDGKLNRAGQVDMTRTALEGFGKGLCATDEVVIEATGNCMAVSRVLAHFVARVVIANPLQVKAIAHAHCFDAVPKLERRVSHDGFVAIGGNYYSVPDRTRTVVEVQQLPDLIRILDLGNVVAEHPVLEGRKQYRVDRSHRTGGSTKRKTGTATGISIGRIGDHVPLRPLALYQAIGAQLAIGDRP